MANSRNESVVALDDCQAGSLAIEMGAIPDDDSEAALLSLRDLSVQPALKQLALRLLDDFGIKRAAIQASLAADGLTEADLWTPGGSETVTASSTEDEIRRYRLKLQYRADFLQAALEATIQELEALANVRGISASSTADEPFGDDSDRSSDTG